METVQNPDHPNVAEMIKLIKSDIAPLHRQIRGLIADKANLVNEVEQRKEDALEAKADALCHVDNWRDTFEGLADHFWDVAITTSDNLHKELAKWKKKYGVTHF
jgi:hypothetical protein